MDFMEKELFVFTIEESKKKNEEIQAKTFDMFIQLIGKMYSREENEAEAEYNLRKEQIRNFLDGVYLQIMKKVDARLVKPMEEGLYEHGYTTRDPYFLGNFKCLMPIIKKNYLDKGVTAMMILHNYSPEATNEDILKAGEGWVNHFLMVIREYAEEYNKKLFVKGIDKKMKNVNIKGIPLGVVKDIVSNMRKYRTKMKKNPA